jgi:hypothetical protein
MGTYWKEYRVLQKCEKKVIQFPFSSECRNRQDMLKYERYEFILFYKQF